MSSTIGSGTRQYQPLEHAVDLPLATVRVAEVGAGDPLLLINGIGAALETWRPLAHRLAAHRRVILFDAPGTGRSHLPARPVRMPALARMVVDLLDALALDDVDVLGYSWGGALAQQLARDAPERVRRLVLAATSPGLGARPPSAAALALLAAPLRFVSADYLGWVAPRVFGGDARRTGVIDRDGATLDGWLGQPPRQLGYAYQAYAFTGWTSLPWLHRLQVPALVIGGDDDPLVPASNVRAIARRLPAARLEIVPGGGHLWLLEQPDRSARLIQAFLAGSPVPAGAAC